jgi:cytochrome c553
MRMSQKLQFLLGLGILLAGAGPGRAAKPDGAEIYRSLCAECHGRVGEGVKGKFDDPLIGDESISRLARVIHKTMPEDAEEKCVDADAAAVAEYIYHEFYSPGSRRRQGTARIELARMTVRQFRESVADLVGSFYGGRDVDDRRGLEADYYKSRGSSRDKRAFKRVDAAVDFNFGTNAPAGEGFKNEEFSIRWEGSILADETGWHEFILQTENGAQLRVNRGEKPLIDGYVATGDRDRRQTAKIFLLGGRAYPLSLSWFKYKDKSASVRLSWIPPHGVEEIIPTRNLCPVEVRPVMVVKQTFPPDDNSAGYERGVSVSRGHVRGVGGGGLDPGESGADGRRPVAGRGLAREAETLRTGLCRTGFSSSA